MRCISSLPEIVTAALRKRLKPSIALTLDGFVAQLVAGFSGTSN
jgi:hypothetical protein